MSLTAGLNLINIRVKGREGNLTLPPVRKRNATSQDLKSLDAEARKLYLDTHGCQPESVDIKIEKRDNRA